MPLSGFRAADAFTLTIAKQSNTYKVLRMEAPTVSFAGAAIASGSGNTAQNVAPPLISWYYPAPSFSSALLSVLPVRSPVYSLWWADVARTKQFFSVKVFSRTKLNVYNARCVVGMCKWRRYTGWTQTSREEAFHAEQNLLAVRRYQPHLTPASLKHMYLQT
jgi:hypothetical protein